MLIYGNNIALPAIVFVPLIVEVEDDGDNINGLIEKDIVSG